MAANPKQISLSHKDYKQINLNSSTDRETKYRQEGILKT